MVNDIRIYIEGGGRSDHTKTLMRQGFSEFFRELVTIARERRVDWRIVACGSRENAFRAFQIALKANPKAFNVLLVDSEEAVSQPPWQHLAMRDNWARPQGATDAHCQFMVQCMEAWIIADRNALRAFYGLNFLPNALPQPRNVESTDKVAIANHLERATRNTQKGEYHKINHGTKLLAKIDPRIVRAACPHCERFFVTLTGKMTEDT